MPPGTHLFCVYRITEANLHEVWRIANVSADEDMVLACWPTPVSHYARAAIDFRLLEATELWGLKCLLSDERSHRLSAHWRVAAVATWVKAASTEESQQHRSNAFVDLVALIQLDRLSMHEAADIFLDDSFLSLPSSCK